MPHEVGAGAGFGHGDGGEETSGGQAREPALALFLIRVREEVREDHVELGPYGTQRHQGAGGLLLEDHVVAVVGDTLSPVFLGDREAEQPQ